MIQKLFTNLFNPVSIQNENQQNDKQSEKKQGEKNQMNEKENNIKFSSYIIIDNNKKCQQIQKQNEQNQILNKKLSIQEQLMMNQTFRNYENQFSDFLIMNNSKQEIKALQKSDWKDIIQKRSFKGYQPERIQFSLLKGIPFDIRKDVWLIISGVEKLKNKNKDFNYEQMCNVESPSDSIIIKDLNRTFTEMTYFQTYDKHEKKYEGREKLFRVLRAYSHFDKEIGYTQGMNFIVASLLVHLNPDNEKDIEVVIINKDYEENIFWILVHVMHQKNWRVLFLDGTPGINMMIDNLECKMKEFIPQIYQHIYDVGVIYLQIFINYFNYIYTYYFYSLFFNSILFLLFLFQQFKDIIVFINIIINLYLIIWH